MNHKAFTLAEVIIAIFITGLIFAVTTGIYIVLRDVYYKTDNKAEIVQNGRVILDRMVREIRQSPKISSELPTNPTEAPNEIQFQDGHNSSEISYIRYYLEDNNLKRQLIVYYFPASPNTYVFQDAIDKDPPHDPPVPIILDDRLIGEFVDDIEFWGDKLINISLYLAKNGQNITLFTSVFGRNF